MTRFARGGIEFPQHLEEGARRGIRRRDVGAKPGIENNHLEREPKSRFPDIRARRGRKEEG